MRILINFYNVYVLVKYAVYLVILNILLLSLLLSLFMNY